MSKYSPEIKEKIQKARQDLEEESPYSLFFTNDRSKLCSVLVFKEDDDYKFKINNKDISLDILVEYLKDGGFKLRGVDGMAISDEHFSDFVKKLEDGGVAVNSKLSKAKIVELINNRKKQGVGKGLGF